MSIKFLIHECDRCKKTELFNGNPSLVPPGWVVIGVMSDLGPESANLCGWNCAADHAAERAGYSFEPADGPEDA